MIPSLHVTSREQLGSEDSLSCEVLVIGSGAGGATAAAEFAEAGYEVWVVEEGPHVPSEEFSPNATDMIRRMYREGGATMALGTPPILYQEGSVVGGSTVVNGGMSWRTPDEILERWHREHGLPGIRPEDMEMYFERVESRLHVSLQDPESIGRDNQLLKQAAQRKGWKVIPNLRNQVHCPGSNNCAFGCPTGAKQSALVSYLPRAQHFGARVFSQLRAEALLRKGDRVVGARLAVLDDFGEAVRRVEIHAPFVVVACGSVHTPALLHRSGIKPVSGELGKNLSLHPNAKLVALFDDEIKGWEGVHQAYQVREFQKQGFLFAAVNVPPSVVAMSAPYYGAQLGELMAEYNKMLIAGLLVEDTGTGRVRVLPGGRAQAFYQLNQRDTDQLVRGTALLAEMLFEVGARRILTPFAQIGELRSTDDLRRLQNSKIPKSSIEVLTVHLMGTACMGSDRKRSVTDAYGLAHDTQGLMVADASLFPTPIGVNPMESIQALTTRNVHHVLQQPRKYLA